jgi:hypothetical protein
MQRYQILEEFGYAIADPKGAELRGEFHPGVTGDDLTDEQVYALDVFAVPSGFAVRLEDADPTVAPAPAQTPAPSQALVFVPTPTVASDIQE